MAGGVCNRAENRDQQVGAAVVGGCRRIKTPGNAILDSLVRIDTVDDGGCVIQDVDDLAALSAVAAGICSGPGARGVEGVAAVIGDISDGANNRNNDVSAAVVGGGRRIKVPGRTELDSFVGVAAVD